MTAKTKHGLFIFATLGTLCTGWVFRVQKYSASTEFDVMSQPVRQRGSSVGRGEIFRPEVFRNLLNRAKSEEDEIERDHQLQSLVNSVPLNDLGKVIDAIAFDDLNGTGHDLWLRLVHRWGCLEPGEAAAWAEALASKDSALGKEAMKRVAVAWANHDLKEAASWVERWPEEAGRDGALTAIAYEGARTDPSQALELATRFPFTQENENLIVYSASQWSGVNPQAAWEWAQKNEDTEIRAKIESTILIAWAAEDPVAASQKIDEIIPGRNQDDAIIGVAQRWVQSDPESARRWVMQGTMSPDLRDTAIREIRAIQFSSR